MKKSLSIILTLTILFNIGGYYLLFRVMQNKNQKEIKKEIRRGLKDEELTLIIVSNNDDSELQWTKPEKEFRYKGYMYDVVRVKNTKDKTYYYCINDIKEKRLIAAFNENHKSKKDTEKRIKKVNIIQYFPTNIFLLNNNLPSGLNYVTSDIIYKSNIIDILSPPPKS